MFSRFVRLCLVCSWFTQQTDDPCIGVDGWTGACLWRASDLTAGPDMVGLLVVVALAGLVLFLYSR